MRFLFRERRLAGGRRMCSQVQGGSKLTIERVHLETRIPRHGGEKRRRQILRFLPQPQRERLARGKDICARFRRDSRKQGVANRLQNLRCFFQVLAENLHARMHRTLALHPKMQPRKHQQAKPNALCLAEQSAVTHGFDGPLTVKAGESFLRLRTVNRRRRRGSRAQRLFCSAREFEKEVGKRAPLRFIALHRPQRH